MKTCSKCKLQKPLFAFGRDKSMKDGLRYCCKQCNNLASVEWTKNNPEKKLTARTNYIKNNPEKNSESKAKYKKLNKEKIAIANARYRQEHPDKNTSYGAKRRAKKLQATPTWLSQQQLSEIEEFYTMAKELETVFPWKQHVDHIIPLNNKSVCGLHVPWNLQILSVTANLEKGNKYNG